MSLCNSTFLLLINFLLMDFPQLAIAFIFIFLAYKLHQWRNYKLPPGPYPLPIIGNFHQFEQDTSQCFEKWSQIYGRIMSVWFGSNLHVIVSSSDLAKEVLKDNDQLLANRPRPELLTISTGDGNDLIWADYGTHYINLRKICMLELFSPKRIEALRHVREDEVRNMIESIYVKCGNGDGCGKDVLLRKHLGALASNVVTRLVLGKSFLSHEGGIDEQGLEFENILASEAKHQGLLALTEQMRWVSWFFRLITKKEFSRNLAHRNVLIRAIIEERKVIINDNGDAKDYCFIDALLNLEQENKINEDGMTGLIWDMITAGKDTTAIAIEWAMAELIKNPIVLQKVQGEIDSVIGTDRGMNESDILSLPYLQCVAKEALRLHPPTPLLLPHKASANVRIGGYNIPSGSNVHVNASAIAHDAVMWQNPLEFQPERFLEEDVDIKGHDFRLLPFGAGRRMCPAAQLSIVLVTSVIGHLLHHFNWSLPPGMEPEEIDMSGSYTLVNYMKTPLPVVPTVRLPAHLYKHKGT